MDKLACIKGLIICATPVIPDMKVTFRCLTCSHTVQVEIDRDKIEELARCPRDVCASVGIPATSAAPTNLPRLSLASCPHTSCTSK